MRFKGRFAGRLDKEFDYFRLPDGRADVFIYDLTSEKEVHIDMDGNDDVEFEYDMNQFRVNSETISQDDVLANPMNYIDYEPDVKKSESELIEELTTTTDDIVLMLADIIGGEE